MPNWNPWHGCTKLSAGCVNCYVYRIDARHDKDGSVISKTQNFGLPVKRNRKGEYKINASDGDGVVYTCFTSDFLLPEADEWRIEAWRMIKERSDMRFFFITKRIDRFTVSLPDDWGDGYENVAVGCTCENQDRADYRLPIFLSLPIKYRYIACEPLLERVDISRYLDSRIERVVAGGESGQNARLCDYEWFLDIRGQCEQAGVAFWFKQTGAKFKKDGRIYNIERKHQHSQARKAGIDIGRATGILL